MQKIYSILRIFCRNKGNKEVQWWSNRVPYVIFLLYIPVKGIRMMLAHKYHTSFKPLLVLMVAAVDAEKDAILQGVGTRDHIDVLVGGVGSVVAAVNTTRILAEKKI